jgi:hypothetical protein
VFFYFLTGITGFVKPVAKLQGCIMGKSNVNGGGRGAFVKLVKGGRDGQTSVSIIGDVINHGKLPYWKPGAGGGHQENENEEATSLSIELVQIVCAVTVSPGD